MAQDKPNEAAEAEVENLEDRSVEELFEELEATLRSLESPDTPLEESFGEYERGMRLIKACSEKIDKVEKKMIILQGEAESDGES